MWKSSEQPPCWPPCLPPCRPPCPTPCQPILFFLFLAGHLAYLHVSQHIFSFRLPCYTMSATLSTSMSTTMCTSMSAAMSATMSAAAMSSWRFVRSQGRWQNGNPKVWRTEGRTDDGRTGVGARDTCVSKNRHCTPYCPVPPPTWW